MRRGYGNWGKHLDLFEMFEDFNDDEVVRETYAEELAELQEGSGGPEGRVDFPIFMQTVIRHTMRERFRNVASKWNLYTGDVNAKDLRPHTVSSFGGIRGIRGIAEEGEYRPLTSSEEEGPSYAVGKHGGIYNVTMELVLNDDTDEILDRIPRELGRHMAEYQSKAIVAFFESNPTYSVDGQPFFSANRGNLITGADAAMNETNLMAAIDKMTLRRDNTDTPFDVQPRRIIVRSPSMKAYIDGIIKSQQTGVNDTAQTNVSRDFGDFNTGNSNPVYNVLPKDAVVQEGWLNSPNQWTLLGDAEERPAFVTAWLRNQKDPFIGMKNPDTRGALSSIMDPYSYYFDEIPYKIRHFFGVACGEPMAALRAIAA